MVQLKELIASGANVNVTINVKDLKQFFYEIAQETTKKISENQADEYLTAQQVCELLGVAKSTLWAWDKKHNLLHPRRIGRKTLYLKSEVEAFVRNSKKN